MRDRSVGALPRGQRDVRTRRGAVLHAMQERTQDPGPLKFRK